MALSNEDVQRFARELSLFMELEEACIAKTGGPPSESELRDLCWEAEKKVWGPGGCGRCEPGYGCRRATA